LGLKSAKFDFKFRFIEKPEKRARKICHVINNSAIHCPLLLQFGTAEHNGFSEPAT